MANAQIGTMMIAMYVWMGLSAVATLGMVSAIGLGARRHIPAVSPETGPESMILLNRGTAAGDSKLAHSFAR